MSVIILTEGSKNLGLGHIYRCLSLYEELTNRYISTEFIINGELSSIDIFEDVSYINKNWLNIDYLSELINEQDYVIIDSYLASEEIYDILSKKSKKLFMIDDNQRINYPEGIIINPSLTSNIAEKNYKDASNVLSGPDYIILRSAFYSNEKSSTKDLISNVLVMLGGTDVRNLTESIINEICLKNQNIYFDIIVPATKRDLFKEKYKDENITFHSNLNADEISNLMKKSDFAIAGSGQTTFELIAMQIPFLAIQMVENQKDISKSLKDIFPFGLVLKYDDPILLTKINNVFKEFQNKNIRETFSNIEKNLIDGNGTKRIINEISKDSILSGIRLRKVLKRDIEDVFELSNQDYVRKFSINTDKIKWSNHVNWFKNVLKSTDIVLYAVTNTKDDFLGQIRFNINNDEATISISLSDEVRGKGLSKKLLKLSINRLFSEKEQVNSIIAYININNIVSLSLFENFNFQVIEEENEMAKLILRRSAFLENR